MAGMPIRRARRQAAEHARQLRLRGSEEPPAPDFSSGVSVIPHPEPEPRQYEYHAKPPRQEVMPDSRPDAERGRGSPGHDNARPPATLVAPGAAAPPMSEAEAAMFTKARELSMQIVLDFLGREIDAYAAGADKMRLKQLEIAQGVLALQGRIDPSSLRGQQADDWVGQALAKIKGSA